MAKIAWSDFECKSLFRRLLGDPFFDCDRAKDPK